MSKLMMLKDLLKGGLLRMSMMDLTCSAIALDSAVTLLRNRYHNIEITVSLSSEICDSCQLNATYYITRKIYHFEMLESKLV